MKKLPSKKTLNLLCPEHRVLRRAFTVISIVLILAVATVFSEFAVVRRLKCVGEAEEELEALRAETARLQELCADYGELSREHLRWCYEPNIEKTPDRLEVLSLVEREVFGVCEVRSIVVSGRTLSLELSGLTLEQASSLISSFEDEPAVENATLSTAGGESGSDAKITVTFAVTEVG